MLPAPLDLTSLKPVQQASTSNTSTTANENNSSANEADKSRDAVPSSMIMASMNFVPRQFYPIVNVENH